MRKTLCCILILIICSVCIFSYAEDLNQLQSKSQELQGQIDEANENLENVQNELSSNLQQVQKLDDKITQTEKDLEELNKKIEELQNNIYEVSERLKTVEVSYEKQKELLEQRLVVSYEAGDTNYLDVVLKSKNLGDFISNYYLISEIASYDTELLEEVEKQKKEIENTKKILDNKKEEMTTTKKTQIKTSTILQNSKILRENYISKLSSTEQEIQNQIDEYKRQFKEVENEIKLLAENQVSPNYIGGVMAWPVPGYTRITSKYGMRTHPITGVYKLHTGVDIGAPMGTDFIAANDGTVTKASYNGAYGNMVIIDHGGGISTLYAHGSQIMVEVGQTVKKGDIILKVGSTGYSTGAHAHFEVRVNGEVVDPMPYITSQNNNTENTNTEQGNGTINTITENIINNVTQ